MLESVLRDPHFERGSKDRTKPDSKARANLETSGDYRQRQPVET